MGNYWKMRDGKDEPASGPPEQGEVGGAVITGAGIVEVRAGDVIWWSPDERHWEGGTPQDGMTCFIFQEKGRGAVAFGDRVTDDEYRVGPARSQ